MVTQKENAPRLFYPCIYAEFYLKKIPSPLYKKICLVQKFVNGYDKHTHSYYVWENTP